MTKTRNLFAATIVLTVVVGSTVTAGALRRDDQPGRRPPSPRRPEPITLSFEVRSLDGTGNNRAHPDWGSVDTLYRRIAPATYADGTSAMVSGPDPRYISNRIFNDTAQNIFSNRGMTQWVWTWGQLLDHTFGLRQSSTTDEKVPLAFNTADALEEFRNDLGAISFSRSTPAPNATPRQQTNTVSSYIDGWPVYGGTADRLEWLREGPVNGDLADNSAKLFLPGGYLPVATARGDATTAPHMDLMGRLQGDPTSAVIAGDVRANENIGLTTAHTLLAREHNRIIDLLPTSLTDQQRFDIARRIVGAEEQHITYTQFLPDLGVRLAAYRGYDPKVNTSLSNEFATVGYRAHSMIHGAFDIEVDGEETEIPLNQAFGNPALLQQVGIDAVASGLANEQQYANDEQIDNQLRSVLFQIPGPASADPMACLDGPTLPDCFSGVVDLAALDIQRGRDHGMPSYNDLRRAYGLAPRSSFTAITGESTDALPAGMTIDDPRIVEVVALYDAAGNRVEPGTDEAKEDVVRAVRRSTVAARLKGIYGTIAKVDAFVGMSAEKHVPGTEMGELELAMWTEQFTRLRDGDRFYFLNDPVLDQIRRQYGIDYRITLAQLIVANTDVSPDELPADAFRLTPAPPAHRI